MIPKTSWTERKKISFPRQDTVLANSLTSIPKSLQTRVTVTGKYLRVGLEKFHVRGVTFGPFRPDENGCEYHTPEQADHDFSRMAEVGLDSIRNGEQAQANALEWQIQAAFTEGCCGTFVFSWTDEWFRGGQEIDDGQIVEQGSHQQLIEAKGLYHHFHSIQYEDNAHSRHQKVVAK